MPKNKVKIEPFVTVMTKLRSVAFNQIKFDQKDLAKLRKVWGDFPDNAEVYYQYGITDGLTIIAKDVLTCYDLLDIDLNVTSIIHLDLDSKILKKIKALAKQVSTYESIGDTDLYDLVEGDIRKAYNLGVKDAKIEISRLVLNVASGFNYPQTNWDVLNLLDIKKESNNG